MLVKNWNVKEILKHWLLIAIVVTGLIGLVYVAVQQDLRQGANDPQIQMAEDTAAKLANGQSVQNVVPSEKVDIANSLAPYLIIFNANGIPIASSAQLDGQTPTIPSGVFDYVRQNGEDRFTWRLGCYNPRHLRCNSNPLQEKLVTLINENSRVQCDEVIKPGCIILGNIYTTM